MPRVTLLAAFCLLPFLSLSQQLFDSAPYTDLPDSLLVSLQTYYTRKTAADLEEYRFKESGKWLKYLPQVALTTLGPSAGIQSHTIYQAKNDKVK